MLAVGVTLTLPFAATLPTEGLMLTVEAPVVVQDRREDWPWLI